MAQDRGTAYGEHWSRWHSEHPDMEWHVPYALLQPILGPFLDVALSGDAPRVLDVGCGTSNLGCEFLEAWPSICLTLFDVAEPLIESLRKQHAADGRISCLAGDCRDLSAAGVIDGSVSLALDKGTLDALDSREEQRAMLLSVAQTLRPHGMLASVSFATARRILLLRRAAAELNLALSLHAVDAKPEARLVAILGRELPEIGIVDGGFTARCIDRLLYSGPLRSEPLVRFEHAAMACGALEVEQEELSARRRQGGEAQDGEDSTGAVVWPAAHSTAAHLCARPELVRGRRVVELGAGTGLVGLVAAALGASEVSLTDLRSALPLLERNASRNAAACGGDGSVRVRELKWGREACEGLGGGLVVLACEVVYQHDEETCAALVETMAALAGEDGLCIVSYEFRDGMLADMEFFDRANELFEVDVVPLSPYGFGLAPDDDARLLYVYSPKKLGASASA